jgi:hypothetical protein
MNGHHVRVIVARLADAFSLKRAPLIGSDSSSSSSSSSILPDDFEDEDEWGLAVRQAGHVLG